MKAEKFYESYLKCEFLNYLRLGDIINVRSSIASEYVLGNTGRRADLAVHNGSRFIGIEVKSRHDTLARLRDQLDVYTACFDDVMIVLDERHVEEGLEIASADVEVFEVNRKGDVSLRRAAEIKPRIDPNTRLQLLTIQELKKLTGYCGNAPAKKRLLLEEAKSLPKDAISEAIAVAFRQTFSDTSQNFWRHVKRKRVTPDALCHLSRFASERIRLREKQYEKARFWDAWRQDAFIALQEATA
ncbi:MAG: sce7726 family protein [Notoacmeibacter sp.]|nr:sce7726 family protein [Notoacmeibacter sp.]